MQKKISSFLYWSIFIGLLLFSDLKAQTVENSINLYGTNFPQEKIHMHFDKDIYLPGETIFFKAYLFNGVHPSSLSTNFYTAIYDNKGKLLQQKQYPIFDGTTNGDFELDDTLTTDKIQIIAFTKGMQLNNSSNVYKKTVAIYNKNPGQLLYTSTVNNSISLQFFAEGGNAIEGIPNYFTYKAWYKNGNPAFVKGKIIEEGNNTEIDSFFTNTLGMGKIQFIPQSSKVYSAIWKDEAGNAVSTVLPAINKYGVGLHIEQIENTLHYMITKKINTENLNRLTLIAKMGSQQLYKATIGFNSSMKAVNNIPLDSFSNGLLQLILLDGGNNVLQERMVLINKKDKEPVLIPIERSIASRQKNIIEIEVPDTLLYNLSVSITDINFTNNSPGIKQNLWFKDNLKCLTPQIKQALQNNDQTDIDLLVLTNNWQKYTAEQQNKADDYLSLTVNYKEKKYALPKNETLSLIITDKVNGKQFFNLKPTTQTSYTKTGLIFYDSTKINYKNNQSKDIGGFITLAKDEPLQAFDSISPAGNIFYVDVAQNPLLTFNRDTTMLQNFYTHKPKKFNEVQTIKEVLVKSKKYGNPITLRILELDEKYTSGLFRGIARGYQLNVLDDPNAWAASDIYSYIKYKVPAVSTKYSHNNATTKIYLRGIEPAIIFVDEHETPYEGLDGVNVNQVAYIKIIPGIVVGSSFTTAGGAIYIYLKKGDEPAMPNSPGMKSVMIKGYDIAKEFLNPDYSDKNEISKADFRTTIYWNPYIITDKNNNKIKIEYYNNDISKKLLLTMEGFNEEGKLIHIEKIIE